MNEDKISIIILNWNGWKDTIECLESLYGSNYFNYDIIIVDNFSTDDSIQKIKDYCYGDIEINSKYFDYTKKNKPISLFQFDRWQVDDQLNFYNYFDLSSNSRLILLACEKNYLFSEGFNIGIRFALKNLDPCYLMLLNNDTIVKKDTIKELYNFARKTKNLGLISPFVYDYNSPAQIQQGGEKLKWYFGQKSEKIWEIIDHEDGNIECEYGSGVCIFFKKSLITKIGLLSNDFPLLCGDVDYFIRSLKSGFRNYSIKKAIVLHKMSVSINKVPLFLIRNKVRDRIVLRYKYLNKIGFFLYLLFLPIEFTQIFFAYFLKFKDFYLIKAIFQGFSDAIKFISNAWNIC